MASNPQLTSPPVRVRVEAGDSDSFDRSFTDSFRIGRGSECEVCLEADVVSRVHVEVAFESEQWWVRDLGSTNGTYVDGSRIQRVSLDKELRLQIARDGPVLCLTVEIRVAVPDTDVTAKSSHPEGSMEHYVRHYLGTGESAAPAGDHTMMIRRAFATVQTKQRRKYTLAVAAALGLVGLLMTYAAFQRFQLDAGDVARRKMTKELEGLRQAASAVFDEMKTLDLQIAQLKSVVEAAEQVQLRDQLQRLEDSRRRMATRYDGYIEELGTYRKLNDDEKVVYKMARVFNESEFGMPAGFVNSVRDSIQNYWQGPAGRRRFAQAVQLAQREGYVSNIVKTMQEHGLPAQFFYLALQESDFNIKAVGPPTRWGRAKGMWQFIPATALRYGLDAGPYADNKTVDPQDERHDWRSRRKRRLAIFRLSTARLPRRLDCW